MSLPPVLRVEDVMRRYGVRDERTARKLMHEVGAFTVGGRLVVREDVLDAHERRLAAPAAPARPMAPPRGRARRLTASGPSPADGPDWWRSDAA